MRYLKAFSGQVVVCEIFAELYSMFMKHTYHFMNPIVPGGADHAFQT